MNYSNVSGKGRTHIRGTQNIIHAHSRRGSCASIRKLLEYSTADVMATVAEPMECDSSLPELDVE